MKYLCLVFAEERKLEALSKSEGDALVREHLDFDDTLRENGHFIVAEALESVQTATTVRLRNGRLSATDGPFAETKEQLTGFFLIEASDLNAAIQLAAKIPSIRLGCVEVRPVRNLQIADRAG